VILDVLSEHQEVVHSIAHDIGVDEALVLAFIWEESKGNTWTPRREPKCKLSWEPVESAKKTGQSFVTELEHQQTSWGLMQIMGYNARSLGFVDPLPKLCLPEVGLTYSCKHLKILLHKYPSIQDVACAYNHGHPEKDASGKYVNQDYVDRVMSYYEEVRLALKAKEVS
jgi:soluble lytic murein transglycosylase-like protein